MAGQEVPPKDITSWYTPIQACAYASKIVGVEGSANAIWQRLLGGMIEAASSTSSTMVQDRAPVAEKNPTSIPKRLWKSFTEHGSDLWGAGDARFYLARRPTDGGSITIRHFGVKLNPADVHATLPPLPPEPPKDKLSEVKKEPEPTTVENDDPPQKGPRVTDPHLKGWYELYRQVYTGAAETEANAVASARGMFPSKSVSRDRVRALRGSQKRGPKGPRNSD